MITRELGIRTDQAHGMTEGFGHTLGPWGRFRKTSWTDIALEEETTP